MIDSVERVDYYYTTLADSPGEGARAMSALKDNGVNLLAFLAFPLGGGQSQLDLVPENPAALIKAAARAEWTLSESKRAFLVRGEDRVGAVTDLMDRLATSGVNVTAAAAVSCGQGGRYGMLLWVAPGDYERAADSLGV